MRTERLLGSTSFRLSAAYGVVLLLAFIAAAAGVWVATKSAAEQQVRERIELEMTALQKEITEEGMPAAIAAIKARTESPGALEYRLADSAGAIVVGDLETGSVSPGWSTVKLRDDRGGEDDEEEFLALSEAVAGGGTLTIADDLDQAERVRVAVLSSLLGVAAVTLMLVVGIGIVLARSSMRRMQALSDTMEKVGRGELSARAPEQGSDEIARIGQGVNEMLARIDVLMVNIRRVSTDIAHDLRTPLTHVRQDLETAANAADPATQKNIRIAQSRIDEILRVFQAILRLAEIDAGGARARFAKVDLSSVIERVTDAYRPDIESSGHTLSVGALHPANITGDQDLIVLCLANLLENAMRHTPPGTAIRVEQRSLAGATALIVEDRGPGIPPDQRSHVLEPFARLDISRSTPGAGLGLSIVSAIARLHGARLSLEDASPGLRVVLEWPA